MTVKTEDVQQPPGSPQPTANAGDPPPQQPASQGQPPAPTQGQNTPAPEGKTVIMPTGAFARMKKEEREKGRTAAMKELAEQSGFGSVEEMLLKLPHLRQQSAQPPAGKPQPRGTQSRQVAPPELDDEPLDDDEPQDRAPMPTSFDDKSIKKWHRENSKLKQENAQLNKRVRLTERARKQERQVREALEAEMVLREQAILAGIKDVDYAVRLLTRHLEGKDEAFLGSFNEAEYFASLRESKPYLFGEVVKPANSGTGTPAPGAPKAGEVQQAVGAAGKVDATKMSREEYLAYVARRGLQLAI